MVEPSPNDEDAEFENGISKTLMGGRGTMLPATEGAGNIDGASICGFVRTWERAEGGDSKASLLIVVLEEKDTATAPAAQPAVH